MIELFGCLKVYSLQSGFCTKRTVRNGKHYQKSRIAEHLSCLMTNASCNKLLLMWLPSFNLVPHVFV